MRRFLLTLLALAVSASLAVPAFADSFLMDTSTHTRKSTVDVFIPIGFLGTTHYGLGGWYGYPIVPDGFLPMLNDAFYIEGGAAVEHFSDSIGWISTCSVTWNRVTPMAGVRWDFNITPKFTAFATGKLGYGIGFGDKVDCGSVKWTSGSTGASYSEVATAFGVGGYYRLTDAWAFRFDVGNWFSVGAGTTL